MALTNVTVHQSLVECVMWVCADPRRLIYFGGYGHKQLRDIDNNNRSFILDEASWVKFNGSLFIDSLIKLLKNIIRE